MSAPPPNPDTRDLPYGWIQQYNWEYRQWFYVNTREQPPRSSWEHPLGPPGFTPPPGPPPSDRGFNRSPYGGPPPPPSYGGYPSGYQSYGQPSQGYYSNAPAGGYAAAQPQQVIVEERQKKKGPGIGTALLAGGAGLVGGALLMDAIEDHDQRERDIGFDQGYQDGFDNGSYDDGGFGGGGW